MHSLIETGNGISSTTSLCTG